MAQVKTKAFYHAGERDEFGCRAIGRRYYEVRVSGKIDFDGNDYTDDEERALIDLCARLKENGFAETFYEGGAVWCPLGAFGGIAEEKTDFKARYNEWKTGL